jgi:hypothetical protein
MKIMEIMKTAKIAIIMMIMKNVMTMENVIDKKDLYIAIITNVNIAKIS